MPVAPPEDSVRPKDQRKRETLKRREIERNQRLASMSPAEIDRHQRWQDTHSPRRAAERANRLEKESTMQKKTGSRVELLEEIRTNGAWAAYLASLEIVKDQLASRRERVQAASNILRAGGYFAAQEEGRSAKDPSEMSADELQSLVEDLKQQLAGSEGANPKPAADTVSDLFD